MCVTRNCSSSIAIFCIPFYAQGILTSRNEIRQQQQTKKSESTLNWNFCNKSFQSKPSIKEKQKPIEKQKKCKDNIQHTTLFSSE